jgi:Phytanoyl-CoA dioxygenase (PhyH)
VVRIPGALDPAEVGELSERIMAILDRYDSTAKVSDNMVVVKYDGGAYAEFLSRDDQAFMRRLFASSLPRLAARIMRVRRVTFWRDEAHFKQSGHATNKTPWHHGIGSFPFKGRQILTVWVPLTPVTIEDSPLQSILGSHRQQAIRYRPPTRTDVADLPGYGDIPDFDVQIARGELDVATWTSAPGDAVLFHPFSVHGAPPNTGVNHRLAYVSRWLGDDALWQPDAFSVNDMGGEAELIVNGRPTGPLFPELTL